MKRMSCRFLGSFAVLFLLASAPPILASPENDPRITSIRLEGTNVVVTAQVPTGLRKVTLEGRGKLGVGSWEPRAVSRLDGAGGELTFRLPQSRQLEVLRIRADAQELLPSTFYTGTNSFIGQPTSGGIAFAFGGPSDSRNAEPAAADASRDVVESDIWKIRGDRLYFFNQYRGLQILDIANPDTAAVKGTLPLPAAGEEMYLLGADHAVLLARDGCGWSSQGPESQALIVGVQNDSPRIVASVPIQGQITESRLVGTALYVASQAYQIKTNGTNSVIWEWGTLVSAFDLADPAAPVAKNTLWYPGYGHVVAANDVFLFVVTQDQNNWWKSIVRCITAPDGTMRENAVIAAAGRVPDKFKMNWRDGVFTVISQTQSNARLATRLETFRLPHPASAQPGAVTKLGQLDLGERERLHATRFDGQRVYIVTFFVQFQMDPLWVVDLSDPAQPKIAGQLEIPGFSTFIEPLGDRLAAVGVETNRATVSLFDVANPASPRLLSRIPLGTGWSWSEANNNEKAFAVLPDAKLIIVPFSGTSANNYIQAVQLIDFNRDSLVARGVIEREFQPRRSTAHGDRVLVVSGKEFLSVDATDRDHPQIKLALELAWTVDRLFLQGDHLIALSGNGWWGDGYSPALRISSANDPDRTLAQLELPNKLPILGAAVRDGKLYLAQGQQSFDIFIPPANGTNSPPNPTNPPTLFVSIYDVSALPAVQLLGKSEAALESLGWGASFQAVWPKPGLLVLAGGGGGYWNPWLMWDMGPVWGGPGFRSPVFWGGNGGRLIAFDVSDAATPNFLSDVNLAVNDWWNFSSAYTADGLIYLSHQMLEKPSPAIVCDETTGDCRTNPPPDWVWMQRWYLDAVDYADAKVPTVRQPVNIPGTLKGVSHNGSILYTAGPHWKTDTNWWYDGPQYLDASAYDGVAAHLIDSLLLGRYWSPPVLVKDANVFVGLPAETIDASHTLEAWTLTNAGKFTRLSQTVLSSSPYQFVNFGNLLAVQASDNLSLFNVTDPAAPGLLVSDPPDGCVWYDLTDADGALGRGVWLPLGAYGVATIKLTTP